MDFPTLVSVGSLINSAIGATKNARELAIDTSDIALKEQISSVFDLLLTIRERALALDDEVRDLKAQLADKAAYVGPLAPHGYFYATSDERNQSPLCPSCFQLAPRQIGFMGEARTWNGGLKRDCKKCGKSLFEEPMQTSTKLGSLRPRVQRD